MIKYAYDKYNLDFIGFLDENLMTMDAYSKRTWLNGICEGFHEKGLVPKYSKGGKLKSGIHWDGTSHATLHTPEILKTMTFVGRHKRRLKKFQKCSRSRHENFIFTTKFFRSFPRLIKLYHGKEKPVVSKIEVTFI